MIECNDIFYSLFTLYSAGDIGTDVPVTNITKIPFPGHQIKAESKSCTSLTEV